MSQYEILSIDPTPRPWTARQGPAAGQEFYSFNVVAKGPDGEAKTYEISRRPSSGPPPTGVVEAELKPSGNQYPDKLRLAQKPAQSASGGSYNDPETVRRITRSHSQEMGLRYMAILASLPNADKIPVAWSLEKLTPIIDWFDADVGGADSGVAARGGSPRTQDPPAADVSANGRKGFASDKQKDFFERLLTEQNVQAEPRGTVMLWAETIPTEAISKAIDMLIAKDPEAVPRLLSASEEWAQRNPDGPAPDTRDLDPIGPAGEDIVF
jgi:hypothetical protein